MIIDKTNEQASKVLGKQLTKYPEKYDPKQLVKIERILNRSQYDIDENSLEFSGFDIWNCYECNFLTNKGEPVHFIAKMLVPCDSKYIVESKSMKLYLYSFNMSKFGNSREEGLDIVINMIKNDLSKLLEADVLFSQVTDYSNQSDFKEYMELDLSDIEFNEYSENPKLLEYNTNNQTKNYKIKMSNFRSNCRVTNQPDFSTIVIDLEEANISLKSLAKYLVSFRNESHFHEEIIEAIFTRLDRIIKPKSLMVTGYYTRRGGLDIVPIRTNNSKLIKKYFLKDSVAIPKYYNQ